MAALDELQELLLQLKAAREAKGLSLADLTELTGMDRSALSKLETGQRATPTVETLVRHAGAVGKRLVVSLADAWKAKPSTHGSARLVTANLEPGKQRSPVRALLAKDWQRVVRAGV